ncbi:MAG: ATP-binding protein [Dietzia psychralcaliphila]
MPTGDTTCVVNTPRPSSQWGEVLGDQVVAAAMVDRMAHYADVITLTGSGY